MRLIRTLPLLLLAAACLLAQRSSTPRPDVIFVPTPQAIVDEMLKLARVGPNDVVYDLGCGDGRIAVSAAKLGARAVGIDIDPERIAESKDTALAAGVTSRVTFRNEDLFTADISEATVVTLYLLRSLNIRLRPKLLTELKPGTRIVSHNFSMGDEWEPDKRVTIEENSIYLWTVPAE
ncbi:MAG: class I SAM-dependent methyltransferase [Acidobacteria bacterium]|nr:class I SAM-dependent methyltransferase [Acidobacteriota bacterium]